MMKDGVDIRVSLSLDPDTVRAIEGYNDQTAPFVGDVVSLFTDMYATCGKLHDAAELWRKNPAATREAGILAVGKEASKQQDRLLKRMETVWKGLNANIAHAEAELAKPLEARAHGTMNVEIRNHARSLKPEERTVLIRNAIEADDLTTLASILAAPPYLSGLTAVDRDYYAGEYNKRQNPTMVARLTTMRAASNKLGRDGRLVVFELQKAVGAKQQEIQGISAANERALASLRIEPSA